MMSLLPMSTVISLGGADNPASAGICRLSTSLTRAPLKDRLTTR
jgi:hypothetical protein